MDILNSAVEVGKYITKLRKERHLTQLEVCALADVDVRSLRLLEKGAGGSVKALVAIHAALVRSVSSEVGL